MLEPLDILCPICQAPPGQGCINTLTDEEREPHDLRVGYATNDIVPCVTCQGAGWRPRGLEAKVLRA